MNNLEPLLKSLDMKLPLINSPGSTIENDWYYDAESDIFKGLHVIELVRLEDINTLPTGCRLMCGGCLQHFAIECLRRVRVEFYYEQSGGFVYKDDRHICTPCYQMCIHLLEQELPDCKEPAEYE